MRRWYAVHTHPQSEEQACRHLERQGFAAYLPRYRKIRRHARKTDAVAAPLFPRYLFVEVDLDNQRWRSILSTTGVRNLVGQGDQPTPISPEIITGIRAREDGEGWISLDEQPSFREGDAVRITAGPLSDLEAIFRCREDKDRVTVLLNLMGRVVAVRVAPETLESRT